MQTIDEKIISQNNKSDILLENDKTFKDLNNHIDRLEPGITLTLSHNYTHINGDDPHIPITKDVSIDGKNHYISGNEGAGIFRITEDGVTLTLKNLVFKDARSDNGAVIHTKNNVNVNIINCTFIDNEVIEDGGTIYFDSTGTLDIKDSIFENCRTWIVNESHVKRNGGVINTHDGTLKIDNCIFRNNTAGFGYGGAIYLQGECSGIKNSIFENNTARSRFEELFMSKLIIQMVL